MSSPARFAYAQARLQARHAQRPGGDDWRRLAGIRDPAHYLQTARTTVLRPWVLGLGPQVPVHEMAAQLRRHYRGYVLHTARWLPAPWRASIEWLAALPVLPVLRELLADQPPPSWLHHASDLRGFDQASAAARRQALAGSAWQPLVETGRGGETLRARWLAHWRSLWPADSDAYRRPLEELARRVERHLQWMEQTREVSGEKGREALAALLLRSFRRHRQQPVTAVSHLGLVALDLERLRGQIAERILFSFPEAA